MNKINKMIKLFKILEKSEIKINSKNKFYSKSYIKNKVINKK